MKHSKILIGLILLIWFSFNLYADDKRIILPLASYEQLNYDNQTINSYGAGFVLQNEFSQCVTFFNYYRYRKSLNFDYPDTFYSINLLYDKQKNRRQILGIFKSESDRPVTGGLNTFQAALGYGYRVIDKTNLQLTLGGAIGVSDFGIEYDNGKTWPVIITPLIRCKYQSKLLDMKFDFLTGPNLDVNLFPRNRVRIINEIRMDQFRDARDILFSSSLSYRLFAEDHALGDFAGISAGIRSEEISFDLAEDDELIETQYYAYFIELDATILKISAGSIFDGREQYREEISSNFSSGYFLTINAMYKF